MKSIVRVIISNSIAENLRIVHIILLFIQAKIMIRIVHLKYYAHWLSDQDAAKPEELQPYQREISLIHRLRTRVPWNATCLEEAIVFKKYFRKYRIVIPIFVGLRKGMELKAHAWIMSDSYQGFSTIKVKA